MNVVESIVRRDNFTTCVRLMCGHEAITTDAHVRPGQSLICHECPAFELPGAASPAQLDAITADYVATMRKRGFVLGEPEVAACRRAAGIQDAWRVAFARVLGQ